MSQAVEYVYDLHTVKDDMDVEENAKSPFPLVQVDDEDFYDVPCDPEYDSEDSNAEDNPRNDYPEEISEERDELGSKSSNESEDKSKRARDRSSKLEDFRFHGSLEDGDVIAYENGTYDDYQDEANDSDYTDGDDNDDEDWRWSYG